MSNRDDFLEIADDDEDESDGSEDKPVVTTRFTRHGNGTAAVRVVQKSSAGLTNARGNKATMRRASKAQEAEVMDEDEEEATQVLPDDLE